ncbi:DUF6133 family protein [Faecalispora anaeroviscerum]|uniref:DUF6133 family protein n=1 Tax=Faecalispora anaeroviscerum TaxID=2991836 RepID=UPI0024B94589|nr:DUF6133 family protein [Faecalispora anaeroviscerum]
MRKLALKVRNQMIGKVLVVQSLMRSRKAEGFVDTAIKILISVVIGALLLAGLYALFGNTIMPTVTQRIKEMFNYAG